MAVLPPGYIRLSSKDPRQPGVLQLMAAADRDGNPVPFKLTWCMYDKRNRSGRNGELRTEKCILPHSTIGRKQFKSAIRNVKTMDGTITPVHIYMMTHFNDRIIL
jgi:hypothetical protein